MKRSFMWFAKKQKDDNFLRRVGEIFLPGRIFANKPIYLFGLRAKFSVRFKQVSALECALYSGNYMKIYQKNSRDQKFCPL